MRLIKIKEVMDITGLGSSSVYQFAKDGAFPKQVRLGPRASAWLESEVHDWIMEKLAERD